MLSLDEVNLVDADRFVVGPPHEELELLRREAPVWLHPLPDGPGCWVVTKHADVLACSRDPQTFSADALRGGVLTMTEMPDAERVRSMLQMDPPEHTRRRKVVNRGFTPRLMAALEGRLRELCTTIVDRALEKQDVDFVVDVAAELPLQTIAEIVGVPMEDREQIFHWSNQLVPSEDPEYQVGEDTTTEARMSLIAYAAQLAEDRRSTPRDDILSELIAAEVEGERLGELDLLILFGLLVAAGNETTRNAIAHGMIAFLDHPDELRRLVAHPELMATAVEEIIRWASPVMFFRRNVTRDATIRGVPIKEGQKVALWYLSANRDEEVFDDPFRFDVARTPNEHVGFGGGGPHFCLGASLARIEIRVMFDELFRRVATFEPTGEVQRLRSTTINGIKHMPMRLHPR